jgi:hypothetical protein
MESIIIFDQVLDNFYQQVIDNEQKNNFNTKFYYSSDIKVDLVDTLSFIGLNMNCNWIQSQNFHRPQKGRDTL